MSTAHRRDLLRYGVATAVVATTVVGATHMAAAGATDERAKPPRDPRDFDQDYKGKKIKGVHCRDNVDHKLTINGKKLGLMIVPLPAGEDSKKSVTAVISAMTHYEPFALDEKDNKDGLLKLAMKAVDTLGETELTDLAGDDHNHQ